MAKKAAKSKKASSKKSGKTASPIPQRTIGVLSSIKFSGTAFEQEFVAGLNKAGFTLDVKDARGYDSNDLSTALQLLNSNSNVGLVVTVGGAITELAAADPAYGSSKPFLSIDGGPFPGSPNPGTNNFRWRVNLGSLGDNVRRRSYLRTNFNVQPGQIGLLAHTKSAQSGHENQGWSRRQPVTIDPTDTPNDVQTKFKDAFDNFPN